MLRSSIRCRRARAAVEDRRHGVAEIVGDVLRGRRRDAPESVGRRRRDAAAEFGEERARDRMRRHAKPTLSWPPVTMSATLAARGRINVSGPGQNAAASSPHLRAVARPFRELRCVVQVDDHRVIGGTTLGGENPCAPRPGRAASAPEPVDRLGRKCDQLARVQPFGGARNRRAVRAFDDAHSSALASWWTRSCDPRQNRPPRGSTPSGERKGILLEFKPLPDAQTVRGHGARERQ